MLIVKVVLTKARLRGGVISETYIFVALNDIFDPWPTTTYIIHTVSGAATEIDTKRPP